MLSGWITYTQQTCTDFSQLFSSNREKRALFFFLTLSENISGCFKGTRADRLLVWMYFGGASIFLCEKADILLSDR